MVGITFNGDDIVEDVYQKHRDGTYSLDEEGISFLAGYHLTRDASPTVGFEVGFFGPLEASFSPDLDLLLVDEELKGYEVKGYRADQRKISKGQLYKGLGQAISLLNQPSKLDGGVLKYVSLAYPESEEFDQENWSWKESFIEAVQETPIGIVRVGRDSYETVLEPSENPFYNESLRQEFLSAIQSQTTGADPRNPRHGLENLAMKIKKDKEFDGDMYV